MVGSMCSCLTLVRAEDIVASNKGEGLEEVEVDAMV